MYPAKTVWANNYFIKFIPSQEVFTKKLGTIVK